MVLSKSYQIVSENLPHGFQQVKAIDRVYQCLPIEPSTKTANWENLNELELLNSAGESLQGSQLPSTTCMPFSNGIGGLSISHMDIGECQTAAYYRDSHVPGEAMQTLCLMNPSYADYVDSASDADNMILVHHAAAAAGRGSSLGHSNQLQHHYFGFSSSLSLTQSPTSHHSTVTSVYNTAAVPQSNTQQTSLLLNGLGSSTWAPGSELSFLPVNDTAQLMQPLATRLACMEPGQQQPNSSLVQRLSRPDPDKQGSMFQNGIPVGLTADNSQVSPGSKEALSLSLSAHSNPFQSRCFGMPQTATVFSNCQGLLQGPSEGVNRDDGYTQQWVGNSDQLEMTLRNNRPLSVCYPGDLNSSDSQLKLEVIGQGVPVFRGSLTGSKYMRVALLLLEEVVSLGCRTKNSSTNAKLLPWIGSEPFLDSLSLQDKNTACETGFSPEEGLACVVPRMQLAVTSSRSEQNLANAEHNKQENQELQLKKAKLMAMLDEVDRRYKLYLGQMEAVASTFKSAAGLGAAKTYTTSALQTISKHFCCLTDAIGSQIQAARRALGEDDSSLLGLGRLRYADQQLCQQRGLQPFGMMQQPAWRPQRGLPEQSVSVLRAWLFDHFLHPYPKDADKHMLARQTGLSRNQVSNWFINARVRLWKPMVEEMYLEELKESKMDRTSAETSKRQKSKTETSDNHRSGVSSINNQGGMVVLDNCNACGQDEAGSKDLSVMRSDKQVVPLYQPLNSNLLQYLSGLENGEAQLLEGILKLRNPCGFTPQNQGLMPEDFRRKEALESGSSNGLLPRELGHVTYDTSVDGGEDFSRIPAGYSGVSLTLGLQHPEGVSDAGIPQQLYLQQQQNHFQAQNVTGTLMSQTAMAGSRRRLDEVDHPSIDSAQNSVGLEEMQTRKRFASDIYKQG